MPKVLLNDFKALWNQNRKNILTAIESVGESGWLILGEQVIAFENSLANIFQLSHAIGCANGMDALEIGLRTLGIRAGDKVLTTPLSAFATTLAIIRAEATPVFVDVDSSGLIDLDQCDVALSEDPTIRAMVPVHLYGHSLNLRKLLDLKNKYNLIIVEDCAQSILASYKDMPAGSVGQCAATSFYPTKNLGALGDAGALLTNQEAIANKAKAIRNYGQSEKYIHDLIGMNSRLDEVQAAILDHAFLPLLKTWTETRIRIAQRYISEIKNDFATPLPIPPHSNSVWHLFPMLVQENQRSSLEDHLKSSGVQCGVHYPVIIPDQNALQNPVISSAVPSGELKLARHIAQNILSLPIHPYLEEDEISYVIETVSRWKIK